MTRAELLAAVEAHVTHRLIAEYAALVQANAKLRERVMVAEGALAPLREQITADAKAATERSGTDLVSLDEVRRVVRGHDSARAAGTTGPKAGLHERIARTLLARMEAAK